MNRNLLASISYVLSTVNNSISFPAEEPAICLYENQFQLIASLQDELQ